MRQIEKRLRPLLREGIEIDGTRRDVDFLEGANGSPIASMPANVVLYAEKGGEDEKDLSRFYGSNADG